MKSRSQIQAEITDLLEKIKGGKALTIMVQGESGVGKSRLIRDSLEGTKAQVVVSQMFDSNTTAYSAVGDGIRTLLREDPSLMNRLKLAPQLSALIPEVPGESQPSDKSTLNNSIQEVYHQAAQGQALVHVIEDGQWLDSASVQLIPVITSEVKLPIVFIITYREEGTGADFHLTWLKTALRKIGQVKEFQIPPFSQEESQAFVQKRFKGKASQSFCQRLHHLSGGLPFFIKELTKTLQEKDILVLTQDGLDVSQDSTLPIPQSIKDTISLRLDILSPEAREALEIASNLGVEFNLNLLSDLTQNDEAIDQVLQSGFIRENEPNKGSFGHALVQDVVRKETRWSYRKKINQAIAERLEKEGGNPANIAEHWIAGGNNNRGRDFLIKASRNYCKLFAYQDSVQAALKALELWIDGEEEALRVQLLEQLASCARLSGNLGQSLVALKEMLDSPLVQQDFRKIGETNRALAINYALQESWSLAQNARLKAAEAFEAAELWKEATQENINRANQYIDELQFSKARDASEKGLECARKTRDSEMESRALSVKGYVLSTMGQKYEALNLANQAISIAESDSHYEATAYAYRKLAGVLEYSSDFKESAAAYDNALNFCERKDLDMQSMFCMSCMSWVFFKMGDWKRALDIIGKLFNDPSANDASLASAYAVSALIRAYRGELKTASKMVQDGTPLCKKVNNKMILLILEWPKALIDQNQGNESRAQASYLRMLEFWAETEDVHDVLGGMLAASEFFFENDQPEGLNLTLSAYAKIASQTGNPEAVAGLAYTQGAVSSLNKNFTEAAHNFERALDNFKKINSPLPILQTRIALAQAHLDLDDRSAATDILKACSPLVKQLGVRPIGAKIERMMGQASKSISLSEKPDSIGLTERQIEVLEGLANGLSNKEIASELFLSTRTIDMHVRNIFDHLNCRTRAEAVSISQIKGLLPRI